MPFPPRPHWTHADEMRLWITRQFNWDNGRRPVAETLMTDQLGLPPEKGIHHLRIEVNDQAWGWDAAAGDEIVGPFRMALTIPDLRFRPTPLERFLDQEIGL